MGRNQVLVLCSIALLLLGCGDRSSSGGKAPAFDGEAAYTWLQRQCDLGPRVPNTEAHRQAQEMFRQHFDSLGFAVTMQRFDYPDPYSTDTLRLVNIVASLNPQKKSRLLFGAHWECRPRSEHDPDPARREDFLPGANDGASGTAVLLQVATHLHQLESDAAVDLVLFDAEDWGKSGDLNNYLIGSREFARLATAADYQYAVVLDLVGDKNQQFPREGFSMRYEPDLVDAVWGRAADLGMGDIFTNNNAGPIHDDHLSLLAAGIPALDIIDFDYAYWHTVADTPDKCSAVSLGRVGQLVLSLIQDPI